MSRPTKYREEFAHLALTLCRLGATDAELGTALDVDERSINRWKKLYPEFCQSIKRGKLFADARGVEALYQKATGYLHLQDDIRVINGEVVKTQTIRHYPPDTTACIFWLKNRRPEYWQDRPAQRQPEPEVVIMHNTLQIPGAFQPVAPTEDG
ncbi:terminase [Scandinavium lactucae]|uniref:Terminase n=1 Tax=Scandinavium lactucae TaxID=3095028 RepID=A0ABU4QNS4_9ENTR|nr:MULTISPECIES: terminase [unclassified Scandinavium]MDX6038910.1 terminase [Scandinavium sp. V105_6]MDX6049134.1 terminase [Scandinavium sp. V105_1]